LSIIDWVGLLVVSFFSDC